MTLIYIAGITGIAIAGLLIAKELLDLKKMDKDLDKELETFERGWDNGNDRR